MVTICCDKVQYIPKLLRQQPDLAKNCRAERPLSAPLTCNKRGVGGTFARHVCKRRHLQHTWHTLLFKTWDVKSLKGYVRRPNVIDFVSLLSFLQAFSFSGHRFVSIILFIQSIRVILSRRLMLSETNKCVSGVKYV